VQFHTHRLSSWWWHVHQPQNNTKAQQLTHARISRIQRPAAWTLLRIESLDSAVQLAIPILLKERQSKSVLPIFNISARPQMTLVMKPEVGSHYFLPKVIMWPCCGWELNYERETLTITPDTPHTPCDGRLAILNVIQPSHVFAHRMEIRTIFVQEMVEILSLSVQVMTKTGRSGW